MSSVVLIEGCVRKALRQYSVLTSSYMCCEIGLMRAAFSSTFFVGGG